MGCGESKEKNKIKPSTEDDITPKVYFNVENTEETSVPSSQVIATTPEPSEKRHGKKSSFLSSMRVKNSLAKQPWLIFERVVFLASDKKCLVF